MTAAEIKLELIAAHRAQDWDRAKKLSQLKEQAKKKERPRCVVCGVPLKKRYDIPVTHCRMHSVNARFYSHKLNMKSLITILTIACALAAHAVTLGWNAPAGDTNIASYNLYQGGASGHYTNVISASGTTATAPTAYGSAYYFAVTTVDRNGLESVFSNEVQYSPPQTVTNIYPPNTRALNYSMSQLWPGGGYSAAPYYIIDGVFGTGDSDQIIMVNAPCWCTNIAGSVTVQCSSNQAWTNRVASFYYSLDPTVGRVVDNSGVFFTTVASNGLNTISWSIPCAATNTIKEFQLWAMPSTNAAARYFVGPMVLTFN